jgi:hypothetical protein
VRDQEFKPGGFGRRAFLRLKTRAKLDADLDLIRGAREHGGMHPKPLIHTLLASGICAAAFAFSPALRADADVVPIGNDTFTITCEARTAFNRDTDKLRDKANEEATKYCADHNKQLKVVSLTSKLPMFGTGYARAKITFMALDAGDPRLSNAAPAGATAAPVYAPAPAYAAAPVVMAAPAAPAPPPRLNTDELYSELVKLDDLRKKGILTDDEFQAEKRKLLSRSN